MGKFKGVVLHQEAVGATSGKGVLYIRPGCHSASSLVARGVEKGTTTVNCEVRRLDKILQTFGYVDLIKFDIEGVEHEVFANSQLRHDVRHHIVGELKTDEQSLKHFLALFPHHKAIVNHLTPKMHIVYLHRG